MHSSCQPQWRALRFLYAVYAWKIGTDCGVECVGESGVIWFHAVVRMVTWWCVTSVGLLCMKVRAGEILANCHCTTQSCALRLLWHS